jgi:hypothetical protein
MTSIQIDSDILPPAPRIGRTPTYPYGSMAVGQSFFAPVKHVNPSQWTRTTGFRFRTKAVTENGVVGVRCWRIA